MTMTAAKPAPPLAGTRPQVNPEPTPGSAGSQYHAAVEAALASLRIEINARMAGIPARLSAKLAKAERGDPTKRDQRRADAVRWADDQQTLLLQGLADREAELLTGVRAMELASLEALRGGTVVMEERDIETLILKDGAPVWRRGRKTTKRERIVRPKVLGRDGLETLATAHLKANGEHRARADGTPLQEAMTENQLAAGMRYRLAYEAADPERGLRAVDPGASGGGRTPVDPFGAQACSAMVRRVEAGDALKRMEQIAQEVSGHDGLLVLREVAGKGRTIHSIAPGRRRAIRLTLLLLDALGALADHIGLQ